MKKQLLMICILFTSCILSACSGFIADDFPESLMHPPRLTESQRQITEALINSLDAEPILKYPKSGDYRSAFVFRDINADGKDEALVFYATESSEHTRIVVLNNENDKWVALGSQSGEEQDVEFISFANITSSDTEDIVIGWSDPNGGDKSIVVYSFENGMIRNKMESITDNRYQEYGINDLDQNGLADIFLFSRKSSGSLIKHLSYDGVSIKNISEFRLSDSVEGFAGVSMGKISPGSNQLAIFIDEKITPEEDVFLNDVYHVSSGVPLLATEVFILEDGELSGVIYQDMDRLEDDFPSLYEQTLRMDLSTVSEDVNQDGVIEIPSAALLPGYNRDDFEESELIFLSTFYQLSSDHITLTPVLTAAINHSRGYMVHFPQEWIGHVTIVDFPEYNEWRFIKYDPDLGLDNLSGEFARIRVTAQSEHQDNSAQSYTQFATRGTFTYAGYVLDNIEEDVPKISIHDLEQLFSLLRT